MSGSKDHDDDSVHFNFKIDADRKSGHKVGGGSDCLDTVEAVIHDKQFADRLHQLLVANGFDSIWYRRLSRTDVDYRHPPDEEEER